MSAILALVAILLVGLAVGIVIEAPIISNNIVALTRHPITLPTVNQVVTFATDTYGKAKTLFQSVFNVSLDTPKLEATATVNTNGTSLADSGLQAVFDLPTAQFSLSSANMRSGQDTTVFTWDISILHFSPGPVKLTADVIFSLVSCGQCSSTTFSVPAQLIVTANE